MRTVPARIQRVDGSAEDVVAVEHDGGTELVEPATLSTGDSITFTYEDV